MNKPTRILIALVLAIAARAALAAEVGVAWDAVSHEVEREGVTRDEVYQYRACQFTLSEESTGLCLTVEGRQSEGAVTEAWFASVPCERFHWRVQAISKCASSWPGCVDQSARYGPWSIEDLSQLPTDNGQACIPEVPHALPPAPSARRVDG